MNFFRTTAFTLAAALMSAQAFAEVPEIKGVTINPTPPGAKVGAAYLNIHNPNDDSVVLTHVSSPAISRVEIHFSQIVDDVMKMRKEDSLEIPAHESVTFKHGGYHIMLMDLEAPLMPGALIPLVFHTSEGDVTTEVRVSETIQLPQDDHSLMKNGEMDHSNKKHGEMDHGDTKHGEMDHGDTKHGEMDHDNMTKE